MRSPSEDKARELEEELQKIEAEFLTTKQRFTEAIKVLRGADGLTPIFESVKPALNGHTPPRVEIVDEAIESLASQFSTSELKFQIVKKYPHVKFKGSYLVNRLYALKDRHRLKLLKGGADGAPNVWEKI